MMMMHVKLTKDQQLAVKKLYNRFYDSLNNKSYFNFRKRVNKAIGYRDEYDLRILHIDEIPMTFGITTDGYTHT
jgi:hypothetical protein|tara:strand:- start:139 stop:360 length:222 start_codon:yes stop_codon:yes gene_type:complete